MEELTKAQLKHIAHLLSQDIHRYKQRFNREDSHQVEHHKMLVDALDLVKKGIHND